MKTQLEIPQKQMNTMDNALKETVETRKVLQ